MTHPIFLAAWAARLLAELVGQSVARAWLVGHMGIYNKHNIMLNGMTV